MFVDRLAKFEWMLKDIIENLDKENEKIQQLKMQEKESSVTYQYALNKQSIYTQMIQLYKDYGLITEKGTTMKPSEEYSNTNVNPTDLTNILENLLACLYEKWFYIDDEYVTEGFGQCRNDLLHKGSQGLDPFYEWIEEEFDYELPLAKEQLRIILLRKLNE